MEGRELPLAMAERTEVDPVLVSRQEHWLRKKQRAHDRYLQRAPAQCRRPREVLRRKRCLEQRLQVDQDRVFAVGNDVLGVEIRASKDISKRDLRALSDEETFDLIPRSAWLRLDELHPSEAAFVERADLLEVGLAAIAIEPGDEIEKAGSLSQPDAACRQGNARLRRSRCVRIARRNVCRPLPLRTSGPGSSPPKNLQRSA